MRNKNEFCSNLSFYNNIFPFSKQDRNKNIYNY